VERSVSILAIALAIGAASCGGAQEVSAPALDTLSAPTFATLPDDLADSPQLDALHPRDSAGIPPSSAGAIADQLPAALQALSQLDDPPTALTRLSIYDDDVYFSFPEGGVTGRSVSAIYTPGSEMYVTDPTFNDDAAYSIAPVQADVPGRLREAIERRYPDVRVTSFDLEPDLSHDFGLVWRMSVEDGQGSLGEVYAGLDGAIIAVDVS
jgi:hypothetical protein